MDALVENLNEKGRKENKSPQETLPITYKYFKKEWMEKKGIEENAFDLLCRKGVYPFEYFDSYDKFEERKNHQWICFLVI